MGFTAIFGGTFNPFHIGHYKMLESLQNDKTIDEIWVMPSRIPPHKECDIIASNNERIDMCKLVCEDFNKASVCLVEFEREGKSYTFDTISELKQKYPEKEFLFVIGGDMLVYFDKWYKSEELMKMLPFIAFKRISTNINEFDDCVVRLKENGMKLTVKEDFIPNVSSTEFRKENIKELLPKKVYDYIKERGIYNV